MPDAAGRADLCQRVKPPQAADSGSEFARVRVGEPSSKPDQGGAQVPCTGGTVSRHSRARLCPSDAHAPGRNCGVVPGSRTSSRRSSSQRHQFCTHRRDNPVTSCRRAIVGFERIVRQHAPQPITHAIMSTLRRASARSRAASISSSVRRSHCACEVAGQGGSGWPPTRRSSSAHLPAGATSGIVCSGTWFGSLLATGRQPSASESLRMKL